MPYVIGVDIGATNLRVVISDEDGKFLASGSERTVKEGTGLSVSAQIGRMIHSLLSKAKISVDEIKSIGIGSIGPLDLKEGAIINTPNLPFPYIPLVSPLKEAFNKPVYLINDCTAAVVGEKHFGAGRGLENLVYVTISTGIGGGAYVDGHLLIGKDGNAAEVGHMVVDPQGRLICGCGKRGHWEAYCSGTGIPKLVKMILEERKATGYSEGMKSHLIAYDPDKIDAKTFFDTVRLRDSLALEILDFIGRYNAIGMANLINAYDPSLITLGGSVVLNNEEYILPYIRKYVKDYAINRIPEIKVTPLKGDIVLYGAVAIALGLEEIKPPRP